MKRYVVVGYPLEHSLSPLMHNAAFAAAGLSHEFEYGACPMKKNRLSLLVKAIVDGKIHGANVTMPHKSAILNYLAILHDDAMSAGCVNTVFLDNGTVTGCNTDIPGFMRSIMESEVPVKGERATVVGSGGAAKSVLIGLSKLGIREVTVFARSMTKARRLADLVVSKYGIEFDYHDLQSIVKRSRSSALLVNCTPIGMRGHSIDRTPIPKSVLKNTQTVMDLVYNPIHTRLLGEAKETGCHTISGENMFVYQGATSFEIWTGKKAPIEVMRKTVQRALQGRNGC